MSTTLTFSLTLYGQAIEGISAPIGSTVEFDVLCQDPITRAPIDLTGKAVVSSLSTVDARGNPKTLLFARQAVAGVGTGACVLNWGPSDTVPGGSPVNPGEYAIDFWITDAGTGNRLQLMGTGHVFLTPAVTLPGTVVSPLPSEPPLGQGPQGPVGPTGATGPAGPTGPTGPTGPATSNATPQVLALVGGSGASTSASRDDHVHAHPAQYVASIAALRALAAPAVSFVHMRVTGYYSDGDGGGGKFYWSTSSTVADDGGSIIRPTAVSSGSPGRWLRIIPRGRIDPHMFGAVGDGTSHPLSGYFASLAAAQAIYPHATALTNEIDWCAIQAAINFVVASLSGGGNTSTGGSVWMSKGIYLCDQPIKMAASFGLSLRCNGQGAAVNASLGDTTLIYTGNTAKRFVDVRSTFSVTIDGFSFAYSDPTWTGRIVDFSHYNGSDSQGFHIRRCAMGGTSAVPAYTGAHSCIYLSNAVNGRIENCWYGRAQRGIFFREQDGSYCNAITVDGANVFTYVQKALVNAGGEKNNIIGAFFEGTGGGMKAAYREEYTDVTVAPACTFTFDHVAQTITRSSGSWITDGFATGMTPAVYEAVGGLNVTGLGAITVLTATVMTVASGILANETRTSDCKVYARSTVQDAPAPTSEATLGQTLTFNAAAQSITRTVGSWLAEDDGAYAFIGQSLSVTGTASNNGSFGPVTSVTATVLSFLASTFTFNAAAGTITRTNGSWITDGFTVGMSVQANGTVSNNTTLGTVSGVTATVLTLSSSAIVNETSSTAKVFSLFESAFQAVSQASAGVTFVNETAAAGAHVYQSAGCGPLSFFGCWAGDQFRPTTWLQFGQSQGVSLDGCFWGGGLRVAEFRQSCVDFTAGGGCDYESLQEPFAFRGVADTIKIRGTNASSSADLYVYDSNNPPRSIETFTTLPSATNAAADVFGNNYRKWSADVRDTFTISKLGISADSSIPQALQIKQGNATVLSLGGFTWAGVQSGLIQPTQGTLFINHFAVGPTMINDRYGNTGIGLGQYDSNLNNGTPTSQLHLGGPIALPWRTITADGAVDNRDGRVGLDCTSGVRTATLPDATTCMGRAYAFLKIAGANAAHVATVSGQTIESAASPYVITTRVVLFSDGANWRIESAS